MMSVKHPAHLTDEQLATNSARGDIAAFDELTRRHLAPLYGFLRRLAGGEAADAEDIAQETFIKAFKAIRRYDPKKPFRTWLYAIARNSAIDWLRKKRPTVFSHMGDAEGDYAADIADGELLPDELFSRKELQEEVEGHLQALNPEDRTILLLHYQDGFSFEDIAQTLKMPSATIRSRHRRALARLKASLGATNTNP